MPITAAPQVNTAGWPVNHSRPRPTQLLLPSNTSSTNPTTVGGSTSGSIRNVSSTTFPLLRRDTVICRAVTKAAENVIRQAITLILTDSQTGDKKVSQFMLFSRHFP